MPIKITLKAFPSTQMTKRSIYNVGVGKGNDHRFKQVIPSAQFGGSSTYTKIGTNLGFSVVPNHLSPSLKKAF